MAKPMTGLNWRMKMITAKTPLKIFILLGNHNNHHDSLSSAVELAKLMKCSLQGFYLEDNALLAAAEIPCTREISLWSAQERPMDPVSLQRSLRARAHNAEREFQQIAMKHQIEWSFQTVRGNRLQWILESGSASDILFISGAQRSSDYASVARQPKPSRAPLALVAAKGSAASTRALRTAVDMANQTGRKLIIIVMGENAGEQKQLDNQLAAMLEQYAVNTAVSIMYTAAFELTDEARRIAAHMLILPSDIPQLQGEKLRQFMEQLHQPVILVH